METYILLCLVCFAKSNFFLLFFLQLWGFEVSVLYTLGECYISELDLLLNE